MMDGIFAETFTPNPVVWAKIPAPWSIWDEFFSTASASPLIIIDHRNAGKSREVAGTDPQGESND